MKTILLTFAFGLSSGLSRGQDLNPALVAFADSACACLRLPDAGDAAQTADPAACINQVMLTHFTDIVAACGLDAGTCTEDDLLTVGDLFGNALLRACPDLLLAGYEEGEYAEEEWTFDEEAPDDAGITVEMTVNTVSGTEVLRLGGTDSEGTAHEVWIIEDFQGSELLLIGSPVGRSFRFFCQPASVLDPDTRFFKERWVVYGVE